MSDNCVDVSGEDGIIGAVCVVFGKKYGSINIIFMKKEGLAISVRSNTELANKLSKSGVNFEERKKALSFVSEKLLELESYGS